MRCTGAPQSGHGWPKRPCTAIAGWNAVTFCGQSPASRESRAVQSASVDLVAGHEAVARTARSIFPLAEKASDEPTADLLTQRLTVHEQTAWMLRSLLEE